MVFRRHDVSYRELLIVDTILESTRIPVVSSMLIEVLRSKGYNVSKGNIYSLIDKIKGEYRFGVQINLYSLGLKKLILVFDKKPDNIYKDYLTLQVNLIPFGVLLSYYLPFNVDPHYIISKYNVRSLRNYFILSYQYYPKPKLTKYYRSTGQLIIDVAKEIENELKAIEGLDDIKVDKKLKYFSKLDLLILKELEKDVLRNLRDIANALGEKYDRVFRRLRHILRQGIIEGIVLRGKWLFNTRYAIVFMLKPKREIPLFLAAQGLSRIPFVGNVGVNDKENKLIISIYLHEGIESNEIVEYLRRYFSIQDYYIIDNKSKITYTIPYTREYSKYTRSWMDFVTESVKY